MRPIQASISTSALQHNLGIVRQHVNTAKVFAVVKADAYGHGLINVAHALVDADGFAMINLSAAIDLREAGIEQDLLLLEGVFDEEELRMAASFDISIGVHSDKQINMLENESLVRPVNIYLKMNTGMNRLGFMPGDYAAIYQRLQQCDNVANITLMTHFATADTSIGIEKSLARFKEATKAIDAPVSLANSAAILLHPAAHADWVRAGIMLYGATPAGDVPAADFDLKPAMQLTSEIIAVQTVEKGDSVGYGATFTANEHTRVGIVACGYADGYPRHATTGTPIAVNGSVTETLGRVSMDMLFCDLTDLPEAGVGSSVELWGDAVPVDAVAEACGTIGYELLCAVSARVPMKVIE